MEAEDDSLFETLKRRLPRRHPGGSSEADATAAAAAPAADGRHHPAAVGGLTALPAGTFWPGYGG